MSNTETTHTTFGIGITIPSREFDSRAYLRHVFHLVPKKSLGFYKIKREENERDRNILLARTEWDITCRQDTM